MERTRIEKEMEKWCIVEGFSFSFCRSSVVLFFFLVRFFLFFFLGGFFFSFLFLPFLRSSLRPLHAWARTLMVSSIAVMVALLSFRVPNMAHVHGSCYISHHYTR